MKHALAIALVLCVHVCAVPCAGSNQAALKNRPNLVLIVADDMGWGDVRSHGNDRLDTPVLDRLAADGARFNRFFVSPVCAPTRASLLTGRYHPRTGVAWVTRGLETMRSEEVTLAEALRDAGYATGCFGKWHNGAHYPYNPGGQGFDEFLGFCAGHWNNYFDTTLEHNGRSIKTSGYITDVLTDSAIAFIKKQRGRPFFCYIPYNAPHGPFQVPERYFSKYKGRGFDDKTAAIYGMVESVDDNVGRILKQIETARLTDRTIVLFLTDNGPNGERYNGGMKGIKGSVHEGGVRVPLFIRWPGRIWPGTTVENIAAHIDLFPTLLELCGLPEPRTLSLDGISLVPLLEGKSDGWPERRIFTVQARGGQLPSASGAVRTERHRLVTDGQRCELYDMATDPGQRKDIAAENTSLVETLRSAYDTWLKAVTQNGIERLPIPVGYPQARIVELPAPESYFSGDLRFKGGQGWANDWIAGWQRIEDSVSWEIDVVQPGRFEVTLLFTCPARDVGSRIRVEVAAQAVEGVVGRAHDPEPVSSPDRVPRGEVYEKVWAPLTLGALDLPASRNRLNVKALSKAGEFVMELKAVRLSRLD